MKVAAATQYSGRFEIFDLKQDVHGTFISFTLQFEQHCEGAQAALFGQFLYNANGGVKPRVSVAGAQVLKGNAGTSDGLVTLSLSRPAGKKVEVTYTTADGTATAGTDYVMRHGTATFPRGITTEYVVIPVIGNRQVTGAQSFSLALSAPVGAPLGAGTGQVTITDPNSPQTVLAMTSQPGDYIGGGIPWLETNSYTTFSGSLNNGVAQVNLGEPEFLDTRFRRPVRHAID